MGHDGAPSQRLTIDLRPCGPLQRMAMAVLQAVVGGEEYAAFLRALYAHPGGGWWEEAAQHLVPLCLNHDAMLLGVGFLFNASPAHPHHLPASAPK